MDKIDIAKRWFEKAQRNSNQDDIEEVMDKFFSLYVSYNAIYSQLGSGDRNCATTKMGEYLEREDIRILDNCKNDIKELIKPIEEGSFYIYGNESTLDYKNDEQILEKINEFINDDIRNYKSVLNFIYGLRCNMFHGSKDIIAEQKSLLNPANKVLEKLVERLIN